MKKFLEFVAEDIIKKYGTDLSRIAVIFPNKRASIFLNEQLAIKAKKPLWSPSYITISDFFLKHSPLILGDPIKLVCELHKSFTKCTGIDESLDHFYGWGQLLLSDFDDIDKNMADASKVFKNVRDIHELDDISYLDEEQKRILQKFFSNFKEDDETELKKRFLNLWCHIEDIYNDFKQRLYKQGIAYEGMLYRNVAQELNIDFLYEKYLFIGFNVIQKVEQRIFSYLQNNDKARFYWDFDKYYMPNLSKQSLTENEAGHYISMFQKIFSNELNANNKDIYDNLSKDKDITFVNASTENIQARYVSKWLKEKDRYKKNKNVAIVLCNESLLSTVIHCLPEEVENVNITTGFPLLQTPAASLVNLLVELNIDGYSSSKETFHLHYVIQVLSHPYSRYISQACNSLLYTLKDRRIYYPTVNQLAVDDNLTLLFNMPDDNLSQMQWISSIIRIIADNIREENKNPLLQESIFRTYTLCNRISELIKSGDLNVDKITLQKLIVQLINSTSIPFHGEPAEGIQIMGILETRNLDFDHVLILSCNEGNLPKGINDASFIPYSIRKAYELTTIDNKIAIYAYYFYNLIQRASDLTIAYNKSTDSEHSGEMSRFMLQLMIESNFNIKHLSLQPSLQLIYSQPKEIFKDKDILEKLNNINKISPTAINRYMRCPLQFYYYNVAQIIENDEIGEDGMDNRTFGNIFHVASEKIYNKLIDANKTVTTQALNNILKHKELIERIVDEAFLEVVFNQKSNNKHRPEYNGLQLINREVIIRYIIRLLEIDASLTPLKIEGMEIEVSKKIAFQTSIGTKTINIRGYIDRLDCVKNLNTGKPSLRVVDYKTGNKPSSKINSIKEIFTTPINKSKHTDYYLQTMLYSTIINQHEKYNYNKLFVSPALIFIQHTAETDYNPIISIGKEQVDNIADYEEEFYNYLNQTLTEIFEPNIPFRPTEDTSSCTFCPYRKLCGM